MLSYESAFLSTRPLMKGFVLMLSKYGLDLSFVVAVIASLGVYYTMGTNYFRFRWRHLFESLSDFELSFVCCFTERLSITTLLAIYPCDLYSSVVSVMVCGDGFIMCKTVIYLTIFAQKIGARAILEQKLIILDKIGISPNLNILS